MLNERALAFSQGCSPSITIKTDNAEESILYIFASMMGGRELLVAQLLAVHVYQLLLVSLLLIPCVLDARQCLDQI